MSELDRQWTDHPRLGAWLAEQEAAFGEWAASHPGDWDFSAASVDALERAVRADFAGAAWEDVRAAQHSPRVTAPAWYLGEVCVRAGAVWKVNPAADFEAGAWEGPFVGVPGDPMEDPDHEDLYEDDDYYPASVPVPELRDMFLKDPGAWRLRDVVGEFEEWGRGV
ncbi:hypothetical protein [Streptomyces xanthochromogenes]|uniref:Uncharacterized protein n=1 Tax=Streptomyces xanthochromogenes TaxID=67384 RepID=A0ABQ3AMQ7_9ACTN|nr:hypothetical protein [Streptomyces xanthochromogenes]GGY56743.1 hypothetical protein GCM10010326_59140 [Streptomyces xanthochromogenes]